MKASNNTNQKLYYSPGARLAIYAQGEFLNGHSKTAEGVIRYASNPVVAVIDSSQAGKSVKELMSLPAQTPEIPIVSSIHECLQFQPDALLLGAAWTGGELPKNWKPDILSAIASGLDVINGLHDFLADDPEIAEAAKKHNCQLLDVRRPPEGLQIGSGLALGAKAFIVLTVGSDASVGKMTSSLELVKVGQEYGLSCGFVATGQTGIMVCGEGITIDRVIGDFMSGATEKMVLDSAKNHDFVFVEGQGSLVHPGFSGVTLSLLHGACPQAMILCHKAGKTKIGNTNLAMPALKELIPLYEKMAAQMRKAKVLGIALNTFGMTNEEAKKAVALISQETGLPCCDPVRSGAKILFDAILSYKETLNEH